jgi:CheY-like chemotaxis protein
MDRFNETVKQVTVSGQSLQPAATGQRSTFPDRQRSTVLWYNRWIGHLHDLVIRGGDMKVLVVDDDLAVADVIAGMLEDLGCDVEVRDGVQPALDWLTSGSLPSLIISDIRMPGGRNGIDLAKEVRRSHPNLPIVLVTGYSDRPTDELNLPVLLKPVSQKAFAEVLKTVRATSSGA